MKKTFILTMALWTLFIISGCSNKQSNKLETTASSIEITSEVTETSIATETATEATTLSDAQEQEIIDALKILGDSENLDIIILKNMADYLTDNIVKVLPENADLMLQSYERAQMKALPSYQDAFLASPVQSILLNYSKEDLSQNLVKEEEVRKLITEAATLGYKMEAIEGTVAPYVDYSYFAKFASYTTASTGAFYTLMKEESDHPSQKDAALLIPWEDVLQRGINFEAYLKEYPGAYYENRAMMHLEGYTYVAINGTANVPLFNYDTNAMNDEAKAAYTAFVDKGQQTEFAKLIKSYLSLLKTNNFVKTAEVEAFINEQN